MTTGDNSWNEINDRVVACERCPRLRAHCRAVAAEKRRAFRDETYWGRPVPNFGDPDARLLIVGLAPAAHGANRTGRMFTGDRSGEWLFRALHRAGFASQAESRASGDALRLLDCAITAAAHCAPPDNKPTVDELAACRSHLSNIFDLLRPAAIVALGRLAWQATIFEARRQEWISAKGAAPKFGHAAKVALGPSTTLIGSFHPSQQNTFTGRLTEPMFDATFALAREAVQDALAREAVQDALAREATSSRSS